MRGRCTAMVTGYPAVENPVWSDL